MIRTPLACLLCVLPATAQPAADPVSGFLQRLATSRQGSLVVLGEESFVKAFRALVDQEPLVELLLRIEVPAPDVEGALRARLAWAEGPRWAWLDREGQPRLEGTALPAPAELSERLVGAGWEDRGRLLERHLASQPSAMTAWPELFLHRLDLSRRRMESRLLPMDPKTGLRALRQPLSDAEDARIWGPTAEALDALFRQGTWATTAIGRKSYPTYPGFLPPEAAHSPQMRAVCARHLGQVEEALHQAPEDATLAAWWTLAQISGRPVVELPGMVARLQGSPAQLYGGSSGPYQWVQRSSLWRPFLEACRETGNWKGLLEALREDLAPLEDPDTVPKVRLARWKYNQAIAKVLLEALVRIGRPHEAEKLVRAWAGHGLREAPGLGVEVAEACSASDLARNLKEVMPAEAPTGKTALGERLPRNGQPFLLVLGEGPVAEACQGLARSGDWPELELSMVRVTGSEAAQLASELGRSAPPRWLLLTGTGKVKAEGTSAPTLEGLTRAMTASGMAPPRVRLEAFLSAHPKHAGARWDRVRQELARAERSMAPHLAAMPAEPLLADAGGGVIYRLAKPLPRLKAPLTEAEDRRIWGTAAREIQALFAETDWAALTHPEDLPRVAAHSALLRKAAGQALQAMEAVLAKAPFSASGLWRLWNSYLAVAGGQGTLAFLESLRPLPVLGSLPPSYALDPLVQSCRAMGRWVLLRDMLEKDRLRTWGRDGGKERPDLFKGTWDSRMAPLVEAHLRLGDEAAAELVVRQAYDRYGAKILPASAAAVALACGNRDLALRWSAWKF